MEEEVLKGKTLLVVDDEVDLRDIVASELEYMGARVFQAENIIVAQRILESEKIDLVVSDIRMPGGTGIDLLDQVKKKDVNTPPVILITGFADITTEDAFDKGAEALLNKPFRLDDLIKMVVRYTSPFSSRFQEKSEGVTKSIEAKGEVEVGRGGFSMKFEPNGKRFEVGDNITFDFDFKNEKYSGEAICRWFKAVDQGLHEATIGLEFINLSSQTLGHFKKMGEDTRIVPYIPAQSTKN